MNHFYRRQLLATGLLICTTPVWSLPTGEQLIAGQATVSNPAAGQMQIEQTSQKAVLNWQGFSIAPNETINIHQPNANAALLNRVVGQDASQIQGQLHANGQVYLVNPNGVVFGQGAQVDVSGLVATTHNIKDADFMTGKNHFSQDGASGTVENHGTIKTQHGGVVALIGETVTNTGTIETPKGTTALAAGKTVDLDFQGNGLVEVKVSEAALNAQITNKGAIQADGGRVLMSAKAANSLIDTVINQQGIVKARGLVERNGEIILDGGDHGMTQVSGVLDASGEKGGKIVVTGDKVLLENTAKLNATGNNAGGDILVGGSWQNSDAAIRQANATVVKKGAVLDASAIDKGKGGTVVAWSNIHNADSVTRAYGAFLAKGGMQGGDGGKVETSGHWLNVEGIRMDTAAPKGQAGTWLLDPWNIVITATVDANGTFIGNTWTPTASPSVISPTTIQNALNAGNSVTITTTNAAGTEVGDIIVNSSISKTAGSNATLHLKADNSVIINPNVSIGSSVGKLNVILNANTGIDGTGNVRMNAGSSILSNGGNITLGGSNCTITACVYAVGTGTVNPENRGIQLNNVTLDAAGGNIFMKGQGSSFAGSSNNFGVDILSSQIKTLGIGTIQINGVASGTGGANWGVNITGAGTAISSVDGAINITGLGSGLGDFNNYGVLLDTGTSVESTGLGAITVNGTGGDSFTGASTLGGEHGVMVNTGAAIKSFNGAINIIGTAGGSTSGANVGASIAGNVTSSGSGAITIKGKGTNTGAGLSIASLIGWSGTGTLPTGDISLIASAASSVDSMQMFSGTSIKGLGKLFLQTGADNETMGLAGGLGNFNLDTTELGYIQTGFTDIIVGRTTGFGNISVGANGWTLPNASNLTLRNAGTAGIGGINLGGVISSTGGVTLNTSGSVIDNHTGSADIIANSLDITAGTGMSVDMQVNQLKTNNTSSINGSALRNTSASLTILSLNDNSVGGVGSGIQLTSSGMVNINGPVTTSAGFLLQTTGDINQNSSISTGTDLVLATPTVYHNTAGSNALVSGGRWLVYSNSWLTSTEGGLSTVTGSLHPRLYGMTYSGNPPSTIEAGNHLIYAAQPSVTISANPQTKIYGSLDPLLTYSSTGFVNDDGLIDNPLAYTTGSLIRTAGESVAGSPYSILQGSLNLIGGYNPIFTYTAADFVITPTTPPVVDEPAAIINPLLPQITPLQNAMIFVFQDKKEPNENADLIDTENDGMRLPAKLHTIISLAIPCK